MKENVINKAFGRLTITADCEKTRPRKVIAKCECGKVKEYYLENLRNGYTKSCGCFLAEVTSKRSSLNIKYGFSRHPIRGVWGGMIERCYDKNNQSYKNYGGRGITVCDEWKNNITVFYNWAMVNGWCKGLEMDRKENNGNYEPDNCRFITPAQNSRNRRSNVVVTYNNKTMVLKDWATELEIKYKLLHKHIKYKGFSFQDAINRQLKNKLCQAI